MKLDILLKELNISVTGAEDTEITEVVYDTRKEIVPGALFVCIKGANHDGHDHAYEACLHGAAAIVAEHKVEVCSGTKLIIVPDTRKALSLISAAWFDHPASKLKTIGITGTKGKSTTSYMIRNILSAAGYKTGIIGTIGICIGDDIYPAGNTTPESYVIQESFAKMVEAGCDYVVMEVSSQGLKQHRVYGIMFDIALFTNLEPDHIGTNEHESFEEYMYCKSLLFKQCRQAVVNLDDPHAAYMVKDSDCSIEGFCTVDDSGDPDGPCNEEPSGKEPAVSAMTTAENIRLTKDKDTYGIQYHAAGTVNGDIRLSIPGRFNIYNSLAAVAVCSHVTRDAELMSKALFDTKVLGRLEPVRISDDFTLMIDYAHNAMALESLLNTLREYAPKRLVCLFGCGGNRSKDRRFEMGEVSSKLADLTVVTSDNPRFEEPMDIINDILTGVHRSNGEYITIPDRREAIKYVIDNARPGDVIVLAGKGNEDYQEIKGVKYHMDEREIIADIVAGR